MRSPRVLFVAALVVALAGCTATEPAARPTKAPPTPATTFPSTTATPKGAASVRFDAARAFRTVRRLAVGIGPREATSRAYASAATLVEARLRGLGYQTRRQQLRVPAGISWGVRVPAGRTWNVVATSRTLRAGDRYRLVSAHLDTVPQAPGAEDDASGIAVLLALARMAAADPPPVPVVFVAFAAEEPRGYTDADHHYGSRAFVARLDAVQRASLQGMVSMDRVGVGRAVPVCTAGGTPRLVAELRQAASRAHVPIQRCLNRTSDHWSFVSAGMPAVRVGGTPYAAYHSAADLPRVVDRRQLSRAGRLVWSWLSDPT